MQDIHIGRSIALMEITCQVVIAIRTRIQEPCVWYTVLPYPVTHANDCCCLFITQNLWVITASFAAVRFRPVRPTFGVVTNTEGVRESWDLSCISARLSLLISAYMWNKATWSAKYFVSHHFKWRNFPRREQITPLFVAEVHRESILMSLLFQKKYLSQWVDFLRFGILSRWIDKYW